jgi:hypothetical protein
MRGDEPRQQMLAVLDEKCEWRREFSLAGDTASATRRWLRSSLCEHLIRERLDTAVLLVEEIVGSSGRRAVTSHCDHCWSIPSSPRHGRSPWRVTTPTRLRSARSTRG